MINWKKPPVKTKKSENQYRVDDIMFELSDTTTVLMEEGWHRELS